MSKVKQILCIYPEPIELRVSALLNRHGLAVDLTEVSMREALKAAIERPQWWDLILCDATSYHELEVAEGLTKMQGRCDASLVLIKPPGSQLTPTEAARWGAADVVMRGDMDHLITVCERELRNCHTRKQLREIRYSAATFDPDAKPQLMIATITDLGRRGSVARDDASADAASIAPISVDRARELISKQGLTFEYQPIVAFTTSESYRNMFETLVRLRDESGRLLLPESFLPAVVEAGLIDKVDLWIVRQALATLESMQSCGTRDAVLFVNIASATLQQEQQVKAIGTFATAAHVTPGSIVMEVRKSAFKAAPQGIEMLATLLGKKQHGILVEDPGLEDCDFIRTYSKIITHVKLSRDTIRGLVDGTGSQQALNQFVRCAHHEGIRVIALAVDDGGLLPMLFAAGVDCIQGNFMSKPHAELVYPHVQLIDS